MFGTVYGKGPGGKFTPRWLKIKGIKLEDYKKQLTKSQLACIAARHWDDEAIFSKSRMISGKRHGGDRKSSNRQIPEVVGDTSEILSKRFGVSANYVHQAHQLFLRDLERFERVEAGLEQLPYNKPRMKGKNRDNSFALYRAYDINGVLLYIGITWDVNQRLSSHASHSDWWDEFATMTVERTFSSRQELELAEIDAIQAEKPVHNDTYNGVING